MPDTTGFKTMTLSTPPGIADQVAGDLGVPPQGGGAAGVAPASASNSSNTISGAELAQLGFSPTDWASVLGRFDLLSVSAGPGQPEPNLPGGLPDLLASVPIGVGMITSHGG